MDPVISFFYLSGFLFFYIVGIIVCVIVAFIQDRLATLIFLAALFFSPLVVLILMAFAGKRTVKCSRCAEGIAPQAKLCRHCGHDLLSKPKPKHRKEPLISPNSAALDNAPLNRARQSGR